jgi:hypothetical protein
MNVHSPMHCAKSAKLVTSRTAMAVLLEKNLETLDHFAGRCP